MIENVECHVKCFGFSSLEGMCHGELVGFLQNLILFGLVHTHIIGISLSCARDDGSLKCD